MADTITIPASGTGSATPVVATDDAGAGGHVQIVKLAVAADGSATVIGADAEGLYAQGSIAHDTADAGNPLKVGGKAETTVPTAVADLDRVNAWFSEQGEQVTGSGSLTGSAQATATGVVFTVDMSRYSAISVQTGPAGSPVSPVATFEFSNDNTNWTNSYKLWHAQSGDQWTKVQSALGTSQLYFGNCPTRYFRVNMTTLSSGTMDFYWTAKAAPVAEFGVGNDTTVASGPILMSYNTGAGAPVAIDSEELNKSLNTAIMDWAGNARGAHVDATNRLSVSVDNAPVLGAGTAAIGKLAANSGVDIGDVDVLSLPSLPAGTNAIGKLAANTGVDIGDVDVTSVVPGTAATNLGKAEDVAHTSGDVGVMALGVRNDGSATTLSNANGDYTPLAVDDRGRLNVNGGVAHDGIDGGNPVKVGMRAIAHGTNPTAVAAADRTDWLANRAGVPWVIGGHPNVVTVRANYTAAQTDTAIITVGAGTKIVVTRCSVTADNANTVDVQVRIGFGTVNTPTTTGVVLSHPGIVKGSGVVEGSGSGILGIGADNEDLRITSEVPTTGSIDVVVSYYTVPS